MGDVVDPDAAKRLEATPDNEIFDPFPDRLAIARSAQTREGMAVARAKCKLGGKRPKLSDR